MTTKTSDQRGIAVGRSKFEIPAWKFRIDNSPSLAVLQARRREHLPVELVAILRALTGNESRLIVFTSKEELS
jgi:hypothetical protein